MYSSVVYPLMYSRDPYCLLYYGPLFFCLVVGLLEKRGLLDVICGLCMCEYVGVVTL